MVDTVQKSTLIKNRGPQAPKMIRADRRGRMFDGPHASEREVIAALLEKRPTRLLDDIEVTLGGIASLVTVAANCINDCRQHEGQQAVGDAVSAAWRIADADLLLRRIGLLLRAMCEHEGIEGTGITEPTGRGAMLPTVEQQR